ncbi:sensor histidine kinase [Kitasatospora sp. NPDC088548]|uniref:sensor histidine kinase n=1 Tax=Kitasatospora sp. NPDC088548 TaxID=3364075 RepID=UPI0037F9A0F0
MRTGGQRWDGWLDGGLLAVAAAATGWSVFSLWWALPATAAAFLAGRRTARARSAVAVFAGLVAVGLVAVAVVPRWFVLGTRFVLLSVCVAMGPWLLGRFWRQSQELVRAGWERAERLEREQWLVAEQARLRERARIAQDMHDALGHDLSLIALRAGALKLAPGLAPPHREAAQEIRAGAAVAVERLGEVIGVLRDDDGGAPRGPADASIAQLVVEAAAAGLDVRLAVTGEPDGLPRAAEHAAYRVVQEALTNAAKHAPRALVTVEVGYSAQGARVGVANGPSPAAPAPATGGRGLIGLAERVRLAGGVFTHGPGPDGGFEVVASLPRVRPANTAPAPGPGSALSPGSAPGPASSVRVAETRTAETAGELRRARRRVVRGLAAAVLVPLATGLVLVLAVRGWAFHVTSQAVLDPAGYASLRVGQDRASVRGVLPERQLTYRPPAMAAVPPAPSGEGVECEYYAMSADLLVDWSGDAYRLCFQGQVLVSLDALLR